MSKKRELSLEEIQELKKAYKSVDRRAIFGKIFSIEHEANEDAKRIKLEIIRDKIASHNRGYEGSYRTCQVCGGQQKYKGNAPKELEFDCGNLKIERAFYHCSKCKISSYPLDEQLGLVDGQEQGSLREKLSLLAVISPYNQSEVICDTLLGSAHYAMNLSRMVQREGLRFENRNEEAVFSDSGELERVYLEIDGHMCPTREERQNAEDNGYREAKVVLGFCEKHIVKVSEKRSAILAKTMRAKVTNVDGFKPLVQEVYNSLNGNQVGQLVVIADGAKWIWNMISDIAPHATQILDYAHAKQHIWDAAKLMYGNNSKLSTSWVTKQEELLFQDKVINVIANIRQFVEVVPELETTVKYLESNCARMRYKTFRERGLNIGSGAIESAGKRISAGRIKGPGMRWKVTNLNTILAMRCSFLDGSWSNYWSSAHKLAA